VLDTGGLAAPGAPGPSGGGSGAVGGAGSGGSGNGGAGGVSAMGTGGAGGTGGEGGTGGSGGMPITAVCGDGILAPEAGEHCDDGNNTSNDGCSAMCIYEPSDVCPDASLALGSTPLVFTGSTVGDTGDLNSLNCGGVSADERIFRIVPLLDGELQATLLQDDYTPVLWLRSACSNDTSNHIACATAASLTISAPVTQGSTYYFGVDGDSASEGNFTLQLVIVP
jgi:cysteine-rich repeat protein